MSGITQRLLLSTIIISHSLCAQEPVATEDMLARRQLPARLYTTAAIRAVRTAQGLINAIHSHKDVATELAAELLTLPNDKECALALRLTLNWGAEAGKLASASSSANKRILDASRDRNSLGYYFIHALIDENTTVDTPSLTALLPHSTAPTRKEIVMTLLKAIHQPGLQELHAFFSSAIHGELANCSPYTCYTFTALAALQLLSHPPDIAQITLFTHILTLLASAVSTKKHAELFDAPEAALGALEQLYLPHVLQDHQAPLLHRVATLLPHEYTSVALPIPYPFSLLTHYLTHAGFNINMRSAQRQTVFDILLEAYQETTISSSQGTATYRSPKRLIPAHYRALEPAEEACIQALSTLLLLGARHDSAHPTSAQYTSEEVQPLARLYVTTLPYTDLVDALVQNDTQFFEKTGFNRMSDAFGTIATSAVQSNTIVILQRMQALGIPLAKWATQIWAALAQCPAATMQTAQQLLSLPLPINRRDEHGTTPLHAVTRIAATDFVDSYSWSLVRFLILHGASITAKNNMGETALSLAPLLLAEQMRLWAKQISS